MDVNAQIAELLSNYGDGTDGSSPTAEQWRTVLEGPDERPVVLVNVFRFRERAAYPDGEAVSGQEAFSRYASVSMPALEKVGGRFLHIGAPASGFVGAQETWDMVAIGEYPDLAALSSLFADPKYREAYRHRRAACDRQRVVVSRA